ncbi:uncharacterized protein LOC128883062 isoform X2 [Hylaeus volcanicus]|uniref:uncharacterized protein LOC128883062 isoform X2 n=1 Tax=Hylaeus volcanicus TaxID=313075 RepID=UPI0023B7D0E0|nr:uncharacterized protein LOC128883062 isoform X2 [Hylaeus volcanicus]
MLRCFYSNCVFFFFLICYFENSLYISSELITNAKDITLNQSSISIYTHKQPLQKHYEPMDITFFSMHKNKNQLKHCNGILCINKRAKPLSQPQTLFTVQNGSDRSKHSMNTTLSRSFLNKTHGPARRLYVKNPNYEEFYIDISTTNDTIFSEFQLGEKDLKKPTQPSYLSNGGYKMTKNNLTESPTVNLRSSKINEPLEHEKWVELDEKTSQKSLKKNMTQNQVSLSTALLSVKNKAPHSNKTSTKLSRKTQAQNIKTQQEGNSANNIALTTKLHPSTEREKQHLVKNKQNSLPILNPSNISLLNKRTFNSVLKSANNPEKLSNALHNDSVLHQNFPLLHEISNIKDDQSQPNEMQSSRRQNKMGQEKNQVTNDISTLPTNNDLDKFNIFLSADKFKSLFYNFLNNMTPMDLASLFSGLREKNETLHEKHTGETKKKGNNSLEFFEKNKRASTLVSPKNTTSAEGSAKNEAPLISGERYEMNILDGGFLDNNLSHREREDPSSVTNDSEKSFSGNETLYDDNKKLKKVIREGKKPINNDIPKTSQAIKNQSRVNTSIFRTIKENAINSSKSVLLKSETPQSPLKAEVKSFIIDTPETSTNKTLAETSKDHGFLYENNVLRFPSSTSLSSADACSLVMSFGGYDKKHVCCSQRNGIWWDAKVWSCDRTPSHEDVAVVLHRIELFNANSKNVHIILNGLYILTTKSQQGSLSGGLPLWEICKTHLMSYAQNPSYQPQMYRYPWTFYNESLNEEFHDFFQKTLSIQEICLEFLGLHATHYRQSAKIYLVGQSVFCPSTLSLHDIQTNAETSSREFSVKSLLLHQCINQTNNHISLSQSSTMSDKSRHKIKQPPQLVVGEHSGLLLFTNISIIMGDKGVIQNSGTLLVGPSFARHCDIVPKSLLNPVNQCAISSLLIFEGVSLLAYRPIRVARLEINSFQTSHLSEHFVSQ